MEQFGVPQLRFWVNSCSAKHSKSKHVCEGGEVQVWEAEGARLSPRHPHDALMREDLHPTRQRCPCRRRGAAAAGDKSQQWGCEQISSSSSRAVYVHGRNKLSAGKRGAATGCWCV